MARPGRSAIFSFRPFHIAVDGDVFSCRCECIIPRRAFYRLHARRTCVFDVLRGSCRRRTVRRKCDCCGFRPLFSVLFVDGKRILLAHQPKKGILPVLNIPMHFLPIIGVVLAVAGLGVSIWRLRLSGRSNSIEVRGELDGVVAPEDVVDAFCQLKEYVRDYSPDYLVGINKGGSVVGACLALALELEDDRFATCYVDRHQGAVDWLNVSGKVLIIDDIARSGRTLTAAESHFLKMANVQEVAIATLVAVVDRTERPLFKGITYFALSTMNEALRLPWTNLSPNQKTESIELFKAQQYQEVKNKPTERIAIEALRTFLRASPIGSVRD